MEDEKKVLTVNEWTKDALLQLPLRKWDDTSKEYDSLLILSSGEAHDSGWAMILIIGVVNFQPVEIAVSCCDDIEWKLPAPRFLGPGTDYQLGQFRTDCSLASGALHVWQRGAKFKVAEALSSTEIQMVAHDNYRE